MRLNLVLLATSAVALALAIAVVPPGASRRDLARQGGVALVAMVVITIVDSLDLVIIVLLAAGVALAALAQRGDFATRLRPPVVAAAILALALMFSRTQGPDLLARFAAVGLVGGLAAGIGVFPYIHPSESSESSETSEPGPVWVGFVGPVLAAAVLLRATDLFAADAGGELGAMLVGLGLLNIVWGTVAAWFTERDSTAWRYSFMADWGLALCGFGITVADGRRAALLVFVGILLGRFPLQVAAHQMATERGVADRPTNLIVAALLAGSAPFAGFGARVLLLRGAVQISVPLAVVLTIGFLLWLPVSLRLGRTLSRPRGRRALAVAAIIAVNVVVGLYPLPLLSLAGL